MHIADNGHITSLFNKMDALEALNSRRTVRQYQPDYVIPKDTLEKMVKAMLNSPTGMNVQELDIVVVTNKDKINELTDETYKGFPPEFRQNFDQRKSELGVKNVVTCDASAVFYLVKNERANPDFLGIDAGIMSMALMVAARDFGLDTMCLGCVVMGNKSKVEQLLGVPEGSVVMALAVGKAKDSFKPGPKEILTKVKYIE